MAMFTAAQNIVSFIVYFGHRDGPERWRASDLEAAWRSIFSASI